MPMYTGSARQFKESYDTPFGTGSLIWEAETVVAHILPAMECESRSSADEVPRLALPVARHSESPLSRMLEDYFSGTRVDVGAAINRPCARATHFSAAVAEALGNVPYGMTISYGELASAAGYPRAQRAVGSWLAGNPLPVIIPCHRVIRADGHLGRYSGGKDWKRRLLQLEGNYP